GGSGTVAGHPRVGGGERVHRVRSWPHRRRDRAGLPRTRRAADRGGEDATQARTAQEGRGSKSPIAVSHRHSPITSRACVWASTHQGRSKLNTHRVVMEVSPGETARNSPLEVLAIAATVRAPLLSGDLLLFGTGPGGITHVGMSVTGNQ